ncbi:anti-sigma-I factor RsgI family protein [Halalkalibacter lacteus]|uniref:anti-sigma-I factor RsgI family protein n=1 Tax=Halalkalibacter lacteus TaxID=3090663 RepID=UPI002FC9B4F1
MNVVNGTVVKVTETYIVLLTEKGTFKNVPHPTSPTEIPLIGQSYTHTVKKKSYSSFFKYGSIAAALFFVILASFMFPFGGSAKEAFIVTIDVNPSIELVANENLDVIHAEGLNEDGRKLLSSLQLEDKLYSVIEQIVTETVNLGLFAIEDALIATSVVSLHEDLIEVTPRVKEVIETSLEKNDAMAEIELAIDNHELYEEAKQTNLSINYYREYKMLEASGVVHDQEGIKGKSLADLKKMENQKRKEQKATDKKLKQENNGTPQNHNNSDRANQQNNDNSSKENGQQQSKKDRGNQAEEAKNKGNKPQTEKENRGKQPQNGRENRENPSKSQKEPKGNAPKKSNGNGPKTPNPSNKRGNK